MIHDLESWSVLFSDVILIHAGIRFDYSDPCRVIRPHAERANRLLLHVYALFLCVTKWYGTLVSCVQVKPCFLYITKWYRTLVVCVTEWSHVLLCLLVVCCYVCSGLGLNCMQDLGVEEMLNWLDKPSEERNLTNR